MVTSEGSCRVESAMSAPMTFEWSPPITNGNFPADMIWPQRSATVATAAASASASRPPLRSPGSSQPIFRRSAAEMPVRGSRNSIWLSRQRLIAAGAASAPLPNDDEMSLFAATKTTSACAGSLLMIDAAMSSPSSPCESAPWRKPSTAGAGRQARPSPLTARTIRRKLPERCSFPSPEVRDMTRQKKPDLKPLEMLDLARCATVGQIVDGMSRCSFGARMLGEAAATLAKWCADEKKPLIIYDGLRNGPLGQALGRLVADGLCSGITQ